MPEILEKQLLAAPVVAIARHVPADRLLPAAHALYKGGVRFVEVTLNGRSVGQGSGRSKKEAEQMSAKAAIELLNK